MSWTLDQCSALTTANAFWDMNEPDQGNEIRRPFLFRGPSRLAYNDLFK